MNKTTKKTKRQQTISTDRTLSGAPPGDIIVNFGEATQLQDETTHENTNHGKSSKMGLVLVLNMAMIAGQSAACGSPERTDKTKMNN